MLAEVRSLLTALCLALVAGCAGEDKPPPKATPAKFAALECNVVRSDAPVGSLTLFTSTPAGPAARRHEPVEGTYQLQLHDGVREGEFRGSRWNDTTDLTLHLDEIANAFTIEDSEPEVRGGLTLGGIPLSLLCKGPLARHKK
jgi:hypothetical protein